MSSQLNRVLLAVSAIMLCLAPVASHAITPYNQDFESIIDPADPAALSSDGWLVYGNVSDALGNYMYGYGPFPAPNDGFGFCAVATEQGGVEQGFVQLSVYSDYNNADHATSVVESNVYREYTVEAGDVGRKWQFSFQVKHGNLVPPQEARAFIKTLNPAAGWAMTNFISFDTHDLPETWTGASLNFEIDETLVGQIFQIGFLSTATLYEPSAMYYDNIILQEAVPTAVPNASIAGATLGQNYPNPFNPMTRIDFSVEKTGYVDLSVFDVAGHKIATLHSGNLEAGDHHVQWSGMTDSGMPASSGRYNYLLETSSGQTARSMILLK